MIYGCVNEDNECPKKDSCRRYIELQEMTAKLFNYMCVEENDYVLYMEYIAENEDGE